MTIRVIDIETTGVDPAVDKVCEIASVDLSKTGVINYRNHLVSPGIPMPAQASAVHHLIDDDLAGKPRLSDVITEHQGADTYVAHNASFEKSFLDPILGNPPWVCTYKCALRIWPDLPGHSNQVLRYTLKIIDPLGWDRRQIDPHRALSDCFVTGAIFLEIIKHAPWPTILKWSKEPALHSTFTFGKHRGVKIADAPRDYLDWVLNKSDLDEDWKFSVRTALKAKEAQNV